MMSKKQIILLIFTLISFLWMTCQKQDSSDKIGNKSIETIDTLKNNGTILPQTNSSLPQKTNLLELSNDILIILKNKDFSRLIEYIHPDLGVRFSPYTFIDTLKDQKLTKVQIIEYSKSNKKILWGYYDASGEPIRYDINKYFNKFVYDVDFLKKSKKSFNEIISSSTTTNNMQEIYVGFDFTEFLFPGSDPELGGMDWKSLKLVFKKKDNRNYLVGIIHDQWTP
jgi:hypothetical protein